MRAGRPVVVALALALAVLPVPAGWIEHWYSRGFYLRLQPIVSRVTDLSPLALFDVAALALFAAFVALAAVVSVSTVGTAVQASSIVAHR